MADNDADELLEEGVDSNEPVAEDNDTSQDDIEVVTKKGISKTLLIKITIGLAVLFIAVGGYLFFSSTDKPDEAEAASEEIIEQAPPESNETITVELEEDTEAMEESEVESLSEVDTAVEIVDPIDLESLIEIEKPVESIPTESDNSATEADVGLVELSPMPDVSLEEENQQLKQRISELEAQNILKDKIIKAMQEAPDYAPKPRRYKDNYQDRSKQPSNEPSYVPPPEPKWGEFNRL